MRIKKLIGPLVVVVFLLFITGTYVAYMEKVADMQDRGVWTVSVAGSVYLSGGEVYPVIQTMKCIYDKSPEIPTYGEYLDDMFSGGDDSSLEVSDNQTFVEVNILVTSESDGLSKRTLLDKTIKVAYLWAGGSFESDGKIAAFSYDLGPYVAYYEYSPYKITCEVSVDGHEVKETRYLTIPALVGE